MHDFMHVRRHQNLRKDLNDQEVGDAAEGVQSACVDLPRAVHNPDEIINYKLRCHHPTRGGERDFREAFY